MISRTTLSSMMVSSAIHSGELSCEMVGLRKGGQLRSPRLEGRLGQVHLQAHLRLRLERAP
jgi:hypothetical protein